MTSAVHPQPLLAAAVVAALTVAVCWVVLPGPPRSGPAPAPSPTTTALPPGEVLLVESGVDVSEGGALRAAIADWNRLNPAVPARMDEVRGDTDSQHAAFEKALRSGQADVVNLDSAHLAEFAADPADGGEGLLAPLPRSPAPDGITDAELDAFLPNALKTGLWQHELYGLPLNTDVGLLFTRAGTTAPRTWAELMKRLSADPDDPRLLGLQLNRDEAFVVTVLEQILAVHPEILNADGSAPTVDQDAWVDGLRPLRQAIQAGLVYSAPTVTGQSSEEATTTAFNQGTRLVAMRNWPVWFGQVQPSPVVRPLFGPGVLGGQDLVIAKSSRHPAQALALIRYLTGREVQKRLLLDGKFVPTRTETYTDPEVKASIPYAAVLFAAIGKAVPRPVTPNYRRVSSIILADLRPAVMEGKPVPDTFQRDMQDALTG